MDLLSERRQVRTCSGRRISARCDSKCTEVDQKMMGLSRLKMARTCQAANGDDLCWGLQASKSLRAQESQQKTSRNPDA